MNTATKNIATASNLEIVMLPAPVELNEHELDSVSGGATPAIPATIVIVTGVVGAVAQLAKEVYTYVDAHTAPKPIIITDEDMKKEHY